MKFQYLLLCAAGVPLLAGAQADRTMAAAADPKAPVAPLVYQSVFADYVAAKEAPQPPDKGWIRANRALLDDHADAGTAEPQPGAAAAREPSAAAPAQHTHDHQGARK